MESAIVDPTVQQDVAGEVTVATDHGISTLISNSLCAVHGPSTTASAEEPHLATAVSSYTHTPQLEIIRIVGNDLDCFRYRPQ